MFRRWGLASPFASPSSSPYYRARRFEWRRPIPTPSRVSSMWRRVLPGSTLPRGISRTRWVTSRGDAMLHYAVVFLIIALIAAVFGFGGIAAGASGGAKLFFVFFLFGAVVLFLCAGRAP